MLRKQVSGKIAGSVNSFRTIYLYVPAEDKVVSTRRRGTIHIPEQRTVKSALKDLSLRIRAHLRSDNQDLSGRGDDARVSQALKMYTPGDSHVYVLYCIYMILQVSIRRSERTGTYIYALYLALYYCYSRICMYCIYMILQVSSK